MQSKIEISAELHTFTRTLISISNYISLKTFLENDGYVLMSSRPISYITIFLPISLAAVVNVM